jgi:hypothetical protein
MAITATDGAGVRFDRYVLETLMPDIVGHDRQPSAFLVYLHLWMASACGSQAAQVSLTQIAGGTGLSRRGVQDALNSLERRELVDIERAGVATVPRYYVRMPWRRDT